MALLDRFRPKWKHPNPKVRLEGISTLSDQETLTHIAAGDPDAEVRLAAARRFRDPSLAREVYAALAAGKSIPMHVRMDAACELGDDPRAQIVYAAVARSVEDPSGRVWAVEKLTDPAVLREIAGEERHPEVLLAVAAKLDAASAQRLYAAVAIDRSAPAPERMRAADEVADRELAGRTYAEIATDLETDPQTCLAVVPKLTDRQALSCAARRPIYLPGDDLVRRTANARLELLNRLDQARTATDAPTLYGLLMSDLGGEVRQAAARQLASRIAEPAERELAADRLAQQGVLACMAARTDKPVEERVAAVRKLADPDLLALLIDQGGHRDVIEAIVENPHLVDDAPLQKVVATHQGFVSLVIACVKKLHDQHCLARIAANSFFDNSIRRAALDRISDELPLEEVARSVGAGELAIAAAERLADRSTAQRLLGAFAAGTASEYERRNAVSRISDPSVLAELAGDPREAVRRDVAAAAADQNVLAEMAKTDRSSLVRFSAHLRIIDQDLKAEVARSEESWRERGLAVESLREQSSILAIARQAPFEEIRLAAVNALTGQDDLGEIARSDDTEEVRVAAVRRLTSVDRLLAITALGTRIFETPGSRVAAAAAERLLALSGDSPEAITDDRILCAIAERARSPELRQRAVARVADPAILVRAHPDDSVRLRAVRSVTDQAILLEVVQTDPSSSVRCEAADRLLDADRASLEQAERVARSELRRGRWDWDPDREEREARWIATRRGLPD